MVGAADAKGNGQLNEDQLFTQDQLLPQETDELELILVTAKGRPVRRRVSVTRSQALEIAEQFRQSVASPRQRRDYIEPAQQLYQWLVAPLEADLQAQQITNLVFLMDAGLRSVPVAALHDGTGFLVERYSVGLMPSLSLTDTRYKDVRNLEVLAMGAEEYVDQNPLPAVPLEIAVITEQLWPGRAFLNETFTLKNLEQARAQTPMALSISPPMPNLSRVTLATPISSSRTGDWGLTNCRNWR